MYCLLRIQYSGSEEYCRAKLLLKPVSPLYDAKGGGAANSSDFCRFQIIIHILFLWQIHFINMSRH
jgi:hypothetical protein